MPTMNLFRYLPCVPRIMFAGFLLTATTFAANLFVDPTGIDSNNCVSPVTACLTIQAP